MLGWALQPNKLDILLTSLHMVVTTSTLGITAVKVIKLTSTLGITAVKVTKI